MIKITIHREVKADNYTLGRLYINNEYLCDTLEDKVRLLNDYEDKVYGETAIPSGVYKVILSYSPRFDKVLPELLNVEFFNNIRIHNGNTAKDSSGCILVGMNPNPNEGLVLQSRKTLRKLMEILETDKNNIILAIC